jgi:hypothetical protein
VRNGLAAPDATPFQPQSTENDFHPYPNKNSFLLGNWYWNGGIQKLQESFHKLLSIIGNPDFRTDDV